MDIPGATVTRIFTPVDLAAFNLLTVPALRAAYDVLVFVFANSPVSDADWTTRLVPYMDLGGGSS